MSSKKFFLFCISLAIVLMITTQVAARELAETSNSVDNSKTDETNGLKEAKYPGGFGGFPGGGYPGGGFGGYPGGGYPGGGYPGGGYPGGGFGGYPGGGSGGYPGGGFGGYPGGGRGGFGGYCRFGCCGRSYFGGGCRCCYYPGQAVDAEP